MAFMVHLLPPDIRAEVMKKKSNCMAHITEYALQTQRILRDKTRPLGSGQGNPKPRVLAVQDKDNMPDEDPIISAIDPYMKKNFNMGNRNQNKGKQNQSGSDNNGAKPKSQKKCTYCGKTGHGQLDCFARKNAKAPCYDPKGDPYYPKSDADYTGPGTSKPAAPVTSCNQGFPHWA